MAENNLGLSPYAHDVKTILDEAEKPAEVIEVESGHLLSADTLSLITEKANGGVCSIKINSILTQVDRLSATRPYEQIILPGELGGHQFFEGECKILGQSKQLSSGASIKLAFDGPVFGYLIEDTTFLPVIYFNDRRDDENCSTSLFYTSTQALDERIVAGIDDEKRVAVGMREDGQVVVASEVYDVLLTLLKDGGKDSQEKSHAWRTLKEYLAIESVVSEVLGLKPDETYTREKSFRESIQRISDHVGEFMLKTNQIIVSQKVVKADPRFPAADRYEEVSVTKRDDSTIIEYSCAFPNAIKQNRETLATVTFSRRLGTLAVEQCIEPEKAEPITNFLNQELKKGKKGVLGARVNIEHLKPEVQKWIHETYREAHDHFDRVFPGNTLRFAPVMVRANNKDYLVVMDISDDAIYTPDWKNKKKGNEQKIARWTDMKKDKRLRVTVGRKKYNTVLGMNMDVIQALKLYNPNARKSVWLYGEAADSFRRRLNAVYDPGNPPRMMRDKYRGYRSARPLFICPFEI